MIVKRERREKGGRGRACIARGDTELKGETDAGHIPFPSKTFL